MGVLFKKPIERPNLAVLLFPISDCWPPKEVSDFPTCDIVVSHIIEKIIAHGTQIRG